MILDLATLTGGPVEPVPPPAGAVRPAAEVALPAADVTR